MVTRMCACSVPLVAVLVRAVDAYVTNAPFAGEVVPQNVLQQAAVLLRVNSWGRAISSFCAVMGGLGAGLVVRVLCPLGGVPKLFPVKNPVRAFFGA
jgi:hypothetical protein